VRLVAIAAVAACAQPVPPVRDAPVPAVEDVRYYTVWFGGARVGTAIERETTSATGVVLRREESLVFRRGDATVRLATTIEVVADRALVPSRVAWSERGARPRSAEAVRDAGIWTVREHDGALGEPAIPADAVPAELVPLITRRAGRFAGRVFLPARGFIAGSGRVEPIAPGRLIARLAIDGGALVESTIDVDHDGNYARVVDGDGVIALRATAEAAATAFLPVDLIAAAAIPIRGQRTHALALERSGSAGPRSGAQGRRELIDPGVTLPALPGQRARGDGAIELSPDLPGALPDGPAGRDRAREIAALVAQVRARIAPDLSAYGSPRDATSASTGDCTTFALAYTALAARRAIPTRVVTGLRVDGDRLVRHRWAVSWTGRTWIAVDAAYGAVPAGGDLVGLAVHGADDAGLVAGEAALAQVTSATWR
jgi:transglutaminase-like putative cysteine protease